MTTETALAEALRYVELHPVTQGAGDVEPDEHLWLARAILAAEPRLHLTPDPLVDIVAPSADPQLADLLRDRTLDVFRIAIPIAREVYDRDPEVADTYVAESLRRMADDVAAGKHHPER